MRCDKESQEGMREDSLNHSLRSPDQKREGLKKFTQESESTFLSSVRRGIWKSGAGTGGASDRKNAQDGL